jgi:ketosteroid isomerase-like protein
MDRSSRRSAGFAAVLVALFALLPSAASGQALMMAIAGAEASKVLDDFHDAAAKADFDRYFGHFAEDGVFLGTDGTERWTVEEFKAYARPYFKPGGGWTYRPRDRHLTVQRDGNTAIFDELLDNDGLGETRGSGVLVIEDDEWKIAQYNLSIPIPNALADRVVEIIKSGGR